MTDAEIIAIEESTTDGRDASATTVDIMLVEDSQTLARVYCEYLRREPLTVEHVTTGTEALAAIRLNPPKVMILDIRLPDMSGLNVLDVVRDESIPTNVVVITAHGSVDLALNAVNKGARDYLEKPFTSERLLTTVRNELEHWRLNELVDVIDSIQRRSYCGFVGSSLPMQVVYRFIEGAGSSDASVFITGEAGSGKQVCAEAVHEKSKRSDKPFVVLNCAGKTTSELEVELYGRRASNAATSDSAGTGNRSEFEGLAKLADGGTLYVDEITEMDLSQQAKFLQLVETGWYRSLNSGHSQSVDLRFIFSSREDPLQAVKHRRLREDLYYRVNVIPIELTPLRQREADILEIAEYYLDQFSRVYNKRFTGFDPDVEQALMLYRWPGNVGELKNLIQKIVDQFDDTIVIPAYLPASINTDPDQHVRSNPMAAVLQSIDSGTAKEATAKNIPVNTIRPLWLVERETIEAAIEYFGGNVPKAAAALQVSPSTIYRKRQNWRDQDSE